MKTNLFLLLSFTLLFGACKDEDDGPNCNPEIELDTRYFEFTTDRDQTFIAWTADTSVIRQAEEQLALPQAERKMHINGQILEMPEGCSFNQNWSWYFAPHNWTLSEISIELCDGDPQYVEENLAEYVRIERYCPWSSYVLREMENPF